MIFAFLAIISSVSSVDRVVLNSQKENEIYFNNIIWFYSAYVIIFFGLAFKQLLEKYFKLDEKDKKMISYMVLGSLVSAILSGVSNLFLPNIGIFSLNWFGQVISLSLVFSTGYAILKYKLFGVKGVTFVSFISLFLTSVIIRIVFSSSRIDLFFNSFLFFMSSFLGYLIIKSFITETEEKDRVLKLNKKISVQNQKIELQKKSLEDLLHLKEETLHIVNHQLNTPISIIRSALSMYQDKIWTEDKFVKVVNTEIDRITQTATQFFTANKVEGKFNLNITKADLNTLVQTLIDEKSLLKKVREDNMKIIFKAKGNLPPANCDIEKITEVISNLLDNAIYYSNKNVNVSLDFKENNFIFKVQDSGIGIKKGLETKLFERFSRLDNAKSTRPDGSGLGLYVCKQIVDAHGGKIWVESEGEDRGSTFFVSLPA